VPTVSPPVAKVEVAVVEVALKEGRESVEYSVDPPPEKLPTPWTERMVPGVVVPMPTLPFASMRIRSAPAVEILSVSAPLDHSPVLRSAVKVKTGAPAVPRVLAAKYGEVVVAVAVMVSVTARVVVVAFVTTSVSKVAPVPMSPPVRVPPVRESLSRSMFPMV